MDLSSFWNSKGDATPGGIFNPGSSDYWKNQPTTPQYGSGGSRWTDAFRMAGQALDAFGRNRRDEGAYDWNRGSGFTGGGVEQKGDLTFVYPQQHAPYTIQGKPGFGGTLGTLAGIGASFIPGIGPGIAAALPAIGGGVGSMFG